MSEDFYPALRKPIETAYMKGRRNAPWLEALVRGHAEWGTETHRD
jgi:hypothetical protein